MAPKQSHTHASTCFARSLDSSFRRIGHLTADHPKQIVTVSLLLVNLTARGRPLQLLLCFTAVCSLRIPFTPQVDDLRSGYTPKARLTPLQADPSPGRPLPP